jgi:hypothetical protein
MSEAQGCRAKGQKHKWFKIIEAILERSYSATASIIYGI